MSQFRPTGQLQIAGAYDYTIPGTITQASRSLSDRLNDPHIERNDLTSQLVVDQPILTGGRASGALRVALATSAAGRESLRGVEGDLLVELIAAYSDVRAATYADPGWNEFVRDAMPLVRGGTRRFHHRQR